MTVDRAATKLSVSAETIGEWETGDKLPTIIQLKNCARVYGRPLSAFFLPQAPPLPDDVHDFRRTPDPTTEEYIDQIILEIRRVQNSRENALELATLLGLQPPRFQLEANLESDVVQLADRVRAWLGIGVDQQTTWGDPRLGLKHWLRAIENFGVLVFQCSRISTKAMRGVSISDEFFPSILLNGADAYAGRVFTLFHEFGHLMLRSGGLCDTREYRNVQTRDQQIEVFCNRFSGEFLVPSEAFQKAHSVTRARNEEDWNNNLLGALAKQFSVSREVILGRALHHDFVSRRYYEAKLEELTAEYENRGNTGSTGSFYRTKIRNEGYAYTGLVLTGLNRRAISTAQAADYLGVKVGHFDGIREVMGAA